MLRNVAPFCFSDDALQLNTPCGIVLQRYIWHRLCPSDDMVHVCFDLKIDKQPQVDKYQGFILSLYPRVTLYICNVHCVFTIPRRHLILVIRPKPTRTCLHVTEMVFVLYHKNDRHIIFCFDRSILLFKFQSSNLKKKHPLYLKFIFLPNLKNINRPINPNK